MGGPPKGSFLNPADNCAQVQTSAGWQGNRRYFFKVEGAVMEQFCQGSTNMGGDGKDRNGVARSCAAIKDVHKKPNGMYWIHDAAMPLPSKAVRRGCLDGKDTGGDGSASTQAQSSCNIATSLGLQPGLLWVNVPNLGARQLHCTGKSLSSCQEARAITSRSGIFQVQGVWGWCEMIGNEGWFLVMKMHGSDSQFRYDNAVWTTPQVLRATDYDNGMRYTGGFKSDAFHRMQFRYLKLGMSTGGTTATDLVTLDTGAPTNTLYNILRGGYQAAALAG